MTIGKAKRRETQAECRHTLILTNNCWMHFRCFVVTVVRRPASLSVCVCTRTVCQCNQVRTRVFGAISTIRRTRIFTIPFCCCFGFQILCFFEKKRRELTISFRLTFMCAIDVTMIGVYGTSTGQILDFFFLRARCDVCRSFVRARTSSVFFVFVSALVGAECRTR